MYFARIPLKTSPHIVNGNALHAGLERRAAGGARKLCVRQSAVRREKDQSAAQKADMELVFATQGCRCAGLRRVLVCRRRLITFTGTRPLSWPSSPPTASRKASRSALLWGQLLAQGIHIHFAHRTFQWSNEARGMAAVHCVIIGFGAFDAAKRPSSNTRTSAANRTPSPHATSIPIWWMRRMWCSTTAAHPICAVPEIGFGSMPNDGGIYSVRPGESTSSSRMNRSGKMDTPLSRRGGIHQQHTSAGVCGCKDCPLRIARHAGSDEARAKRSKTSRLPAQSATTQELASYATRCLEKYANRSRAIW